MVYRPDAPVQIPVKTETTRDMNAYQVIKVDINLTPGNPAATYAIIHLVRGYTDNGTFIAVGAEEVKLEGPAFLVEILKPAYEPGVELPPEAAPIPNRWDTVKEGTWAALKAMGFVPDGTVE